MIARQLGVTLCLLCLAGCFRPTPVAGDGAQAKPGDGQAGPDAASLARLPGVAVLIPAYRPVNRIIHVRDWHFVHRDLYALDSTERPQSRPVKTPSSTA